MTKQAQKIITAINEIDPANRTEAQKALLESFQRYAEWKNEDTRLRAELTKLSAEKNAFVESMITEGLFTRVSAKRITFGSCEAAKAAVKKFKKLRLTETRAKRYIKDIHGSIGGCIVLPGSYAAVKVCEELGLDV